MMGTVDAKGRVCCLVFHLLLLRWSESPISAIFGTLGRQKWRLFTKNNFCSFLYVKVLHFESKT
jgi:hypothetical protein